MKRLIVAVFAACSLASCQESIQERAARELKEFTAKNCPTPVINDTRTDSVAFDAATNTVTYYYTLFNTADNKEIINANKERLRALLLEELKKEIKIKPYKDAGFSFQYVYRSARQKDSILYKEMFTQDDYRP